jgi:hypothetical protein
MPVLSPGLAATLAAMGFLAIAAFQAALALGAPFGRAAWGGKSRELPPNLRRASAVAVVIWLLAAMVILGRAGFEMVPLPDVVLTWGTWALVVASVLGAIVNVASSSPWERFGWAPLSLVLALLSWVVASSPAA